MYMFNWMNTSTSMFLLMKFFSLFKLVTIIIVKLVICDVACKNQAFVAEISC